MGMDSMSMSMPCVALMLARASRIIERVFKPKKSILMRPVDSITLPSYCVTMRSSPVSLSTAVLTGTQSVMSSRPMMTPHACTPVLRTLPSSLRANSMVSTTRGSLLCNSAANSGNARRQLAMEIFILPPLPSSGMSLGLPGMNFAKRSLSGMGRSSTRATSLIAIFEAMVP